MTKTRSLKFLLAALCTFSAFSLQADTIERENSDQDVDIQALREWVNTKRQVTVKEIGGNLSISGEVKTEFQSTGATIDGVSQRGYGSYPSTRTYDIGVNLMLDYRADATWSSFKLEFNNDAGIISGTTNNIKLSRAYFGARAVDGDSCYLDFELGRRKIGAIFDSKLQFGSYFDGILAKYDQSFDRVGDFYVHMGTFVIDENIDQYGYVGETGMMNIANTGLYAKYSLIDWDTKDMHDVLKQRIFDFLVSQLTLGYKFYPAKLQKQVTIYLAGLYNSKAKRLEVSDHKKANWGTYIGFSMGELKRQGDWALDANYQLLAAQCVPNFDANGIGLPSEDGYGFYAHLKNSKDKKSELKASAAELEANKTGKAQGNVNYRGVSITLNYLLMSNLTVMQQWQQSVTLDHDIGPSRRFKQYELEFIYAF